MDSIHGEFHDLNDGVYSNAQVPAVAKVAGFERFCIQELTRFLQSVGFTVQSSRKGNTMIGVFFARRDKEFLAKTQRRKDEQPIGEVNLCSF